MRDAPWFALGYRSAKPGNGLVAARMFAQNHLVCGLHGFLVGFLVAESGLFVGVACFFVCAVGFGNATFFLTTPNAPAMLPSLPPFQTASGRRNGQSETRFRLPRAAIPPG